MGALQGVAVLCSSKPRRGCRRRRREEFAVPAIGTELEALRVAIRPVARLAPAEVARREALAAARLHARLVPVGGTYRWRRELWARRRCWWRGWRRGKWWRRWRWRRQRRERWAGAAVFNLALCALWQGAGRRVAVPCAHDTPRYITTAPAASVSCAVNAFLLLARLFGAPGLATASRVRHPHNGDDEPDEP